MVLYTLLDEGTIFANPEYNGPNLEAITLANGVLLLVERLERGCRIERVISGNANAYLLSEYQPGQVINLP